MAKYLPFPLAVPTWATNPTFPAGINPWNLGPTRVNPGGAFIANGFTPATQPPAEVMNYELGIVCDTLALQNQVALHAALSSFRNVQVANSGTVTVFTQLIGLRQVRSYDANGERERLPTLFGALTTTNQAFFNISGDGLQWLAPVNTPSFSWTNFTEARPGAPGEIMILRTADPTVGYSQDHGASWHSASPGYPGGAGNTIGLHYAPGTTTYYVLGTNAVVGAFGALAASPAPTFFTMPFPGTATAFTATMTPEFADDGGSNIVVVATANGSITTPTIYWSNNAGVSWSRAQILSPGSTVANVTYNKAQGRFAAWDDQGFVWVSITGQSWFLVLGTPTATAAHGFTSRDFSLCSCGPAIVKSIANAQTGLSMKGIAYSLDLGGTWNYHYLTTDVIVAVHGFNNRVYVLTNGTQTWNMFVSDPLGAPLNEI